MGNQTEIGIKFTNQVTGQTKLEKLATNLNTIKSALSGFDKGTLETISNSADNIKSMSKDSTTTANTIKKGFNSSSIVAFGRSILNAWQGMVKLTSSSMDYVESLNLFAVSFKEQGKSVEETTHKAQKFTNTLSEMYGLDESWLTETTGKFKQLANAMGLGDETGTKLAELLTGMSLDISSLYNTDFSSASSVLQSSLAGQTKPIRGLAGGDITQATLQTTLDNLGIDKQISNLSYAEKRLIIIVSLTQQLNDSIGDMGRTIESPANQMRVLNSQWERLTRAVGNMFLPLLTKILPYLNAILMVLTEIISNIAVLFGYNEEDALDNVSDVSTYVDSIADSLDDAAESSNKLRSGLRGFDKLNNISSSTSTSSSSASSTGISSDILNAFNNAYDSYNKKLSNVNMKATQIRDNIMDWLGFTKQTDEETGDVSFKFDHITGGTVLGALAVGGTIFLGIKKIVDFFKTIKGIKLVSGSVLGTLMGTNSSKTLEGVSSAGKAAQGLTFKLPSIKTVLTGITELALIIAACTAIVAAFALLNKIPGFSEFMQGGIDALVNIFTGIGKIIIPVAGISLVAAGLGVAQSVIYPGLLALAVVIGGATLVIAAYGGLAQIPGITEFANSGIDLLCTIFEGVGKIAGVLVGGIIEGVSTALCNSLTTFGTALSDFATNASGFFESVSTYGSGTFDAISDLAVALKNITAAELLDSISNWITGSNNLDTFGSELATFGTNFKCFADNIEGLDGNVVNNTKLISDAMKYINEFSKDIPNEGGLAGLIAGNNNVDVFGQELSTFGSDFAKYSNNVKATASDVVEQSKKVKDAMDYIIDFAKRIPNEGGVAAFFAGDNGIEKFGENLASFGGNFKKYSDTVTKIDTTKVNAVSKAIGDIVDYFVTVKDKGINSTIKDFGNKLKDSANNVKSFFSDALSWANGYNGGYNFGAGIASGIRDALNKNKIKINLQGTDGKSTGNSFTFAASITKYADGLLAGLPKVGQLFVANEKGPELVGSLGGQSFVANQNQIMEMISKNVNPSQSVNPTIIVQVGNKEIARQVITDLQSMAKTNGKPIKIGG